MRIVRLGSVLLLALLSAQVLLADETLEPSSSNLVTRYTYDSTTHILQLTPDTTQPDCSTSMLTTTCYDSGMDSMGHTYRYTYDASTSYPADFMQGTTSTDSNGSVTRYTYDSADSGTPPGSDPAGLRVTYTYDSTPYTATIDTIEAITPMGKPTYFQYDGSFDGPGPGNTTRFEYDDRPLTCAMANPCMIDMVTTTNYAYDSGIQGGAVTTPEPSSLLLLATGLLGAWKFRNKIRA